MATFNDDRNPTEVFEDVFVYARDPDIVKKNIKFVPKEESGKWMLFYSKKELNEKWTQIKQLYFEHKLTGIIRMKVFTGVETERSSDHSSGVIICYCGPCSDKDTVEIYGRNLIELMKYENKTSFMRYKSDEQTRGGTRATGQKINSLYKLPTWKPSTHSQINENWRK